MRIVLLCAICFLVYSGDVAIADSPVGRWSGSFNGVDKGGSASATFRSNGSCTLTALGISASGSYGGGSIHVSAHGYSITLSYSYRGNSMTISGRKGKYSGSMSLSRVGGSADVAAVAEAEKARAVFGLWTAKSDGIMYDVSLYMDGFLYWVETPQSESDTQEGAIVLEDTPRAYGALLTISEGKLILNPLEDSSSTDMPALWPEADEASGGAWEFTYKVDEKGLSLSKGEQVLLTLNHEKDTDTIPPETLFRPYIALGKGDQGEAVRQLQEALIASGFLDGTADGIFGAKTKEAVKTFQIKYGMNADGIAGNGVFSALYKED